MASSTEYSEELAEEICARMADGESLSHICRDSDMPSRRAVQQWQKSREGFLEQYQQAYRDRAQTHAEEIIEICDDCDGESNSEVAKAKLRAWARTWIASKLLPDTYGNLQKHAFEGSEDGALTVVLKTAAKAKE